MKYLLSIILCLWAGCAWAFPPGFIGAVTQGSVDGGPETLSPNAGGTINWTLWDGGATSADHYGDMADTSDSTYAYATLDSKSERLGFTDSVIAGTITSVDVCATMKTLNGVGQVRFFALNTSSINGSYITPASGTYTEYCSNFPIDPNTSYAWTLSGVNAATFGFMTHVTAFASSGDTAYASKLWIKINR